MDPNFASAHFNLSIAYQDMGKYDLWLQEWEKYATAANDREDLAVAEDAARVYRKSATRLHCAKSLRVRKNLQWYRNFAQTTDEEVRELLRRAADLSSRKAA